MVERKALEEKFKQARGNLLLVVVLSLVNVILTLAESGYTFLFSATFPTFSVGMGQVLTEESGNNTALTIGVVLAFLSIAFYLACYLLSKRFKPFMLVALIFLVFDTVLQLWLLTLGIDLWAFIDLAFHVWILYSLSMGLKAWGDMKKLPADTVVVEENPMEGGSL